MTVSNVTSQALLGSLVYFELGIPKGRSIVAAQIDLEPKLVSITPNTGSVGGTLIIANVQGVGTSSQSPDLVDSAGESVCQSVTITDYATVECLTKV